MAFNVLARQPGAPVLPEEEGQNPDQQHRIAQNVDDECREESAKLVGVPIDSLDHLAWGVAVVEGHVQGQAVTREIGSQRVRGRPANPAAGVGRQDGHDLLNHSDRGE
jgi:hypothetical protein